MLVNAGRFQTETPPERQEAFDTVLWSPEAEIVFLDADLADPGPEIDMASSITCALEARRVR